MSLDFFATRKPAVKLATLEIKATRMACIAVIFATSTPVSHEPGGQDMAGPAESSGAMHDHRSSGVVRRYEKR